MTRPPPLPCDINHGGVPIVRFSWPASAACAVVRLRPIPRRSAAPRMAPVPRALATGALVSRSRLAGHMVQMRTRTQRAGSALAVRLAAVWLSLALRTSLPACSSRISSVTIQSPTVRLAREPLSAMGAKASCSSSLASCWSSATAENGSGAEYAYRPVAHPAEAECCDRRPGQPLTGRSG